MFHAAGKTGLAYLKKLSMTKVVGAAGAASFGSLSYSKRPGQSDISLVLDGKENGLLYRIVSDTLDDDEIVEKLVNKDGFQEFVDMLMDPEYDKLSEEDRPALPVPDFYVSTGSTASLEAQDSEDDHASIAHGPASHETHETDEEKKEAALCRRCSSVVDSEDESDGTAYNSKGHAGRPPKNRKEIENRKYEEAAKKLIMSAVVGMLVAATLVSCGQTKKGLRLADIVFNGFNKLVKARQAAAHFAAAAASTTTSVATE